MKKLIMATAALACIASVVSAETVSSANIVGYAKITTPATGKFGLVALTQFTDGTTNSAYDIQSIISNLEDLNADGLGSSAAGADKLYVWNGSGYATYALFQDGDQGPYWASTTEGGWEMPFFGVNPASASIDRGASCWLETAATGASAEALCTGEVPTDGTNYISVATGFSLISYPFTAAINLNDLKVINAEAAGLGSHMEGADKLYVWNGSGYDTYAMFQDGDQGPYWASTTEGGWDMPFFGVNPANAVLDIGAGFWYESASDKSIGFVQNYTVAP